MKPHSRSDALPALFYAIPGADAGALLTPKRVQQLAAMRDAGIHGFEINYPLAEGWPMPGCYAFEGLDARLKHVLEIDPRARILLRVELHAPEFWYATRPQDAVDYAMGRPNGRISGADLTTGERPLRISLASAPWRQATSEALAALVRHLGKTDTGRRVAGIMTAGCTQGEWHYWGFFYLPDTGPAMTAHFRRYARRLCRGDLSVLAARWGMRLADWQDVRPPARERLRDGPSTFRDGPHAAWTLDYVRCHQRLLADTLTGFCRTVKTASRGGLLAGAFYGYLLNTPWRDEGGHLEFDRVLRSKWVDYLAAPQVYDVHARDIGGTGLDRGLVASVQRAGKIWFGEADTPTHIGRTMKVYWKTRAEIARNAADSVALVRRDAARALTQGTRLWWFDFGRNYKGGEYLHPQIMAEIANLQRLAQWAAKRDLRPVAQMAVAYDCESLYHMSHWRAGRDSVSSGVIDQLAREAQYVGAPVELLRWQDVEPRHRLVVVANAFHLDPQRRAQLQRHICRGGRTVLWLYAPGCLGGGGTAAEGVTETTGIVVKQVRGAAEPCIRFAQDSDLLKGLRGREFRYAAAPVWMEKDADLAAPGTLQPAFRVADRSAQVLAAWADRGGAVLVAKDLPWGRGVYCALPLVPALLLRNLLEAAGGQIYCTGEGVLMANSGVLACHTRTGGRRTFQLPDAADVVDGANGRIVARGATCFTVVLPPRSTTIYCLVRTRSPKTGVLSSPLFSRARRS